MHRASPSVVPFVLLLTVTPAAVALISVEEEIEIGRELQAEVRKKVPELEQAAVQEYVAELGRALAAASGGPSYPYSFSIANYREINAFALPGGPIWIHRGAMEASRTEAQLVGVLAHEVAHIAERHAAEQMTKGLVAEGLLGLLGALLGSGGGARTAEMSARVLAGGLFLKFSRDDEREADRVGAQIMSRAGWDPAGMAEFLQILRDRQGRDPASVEVFLSTHPSPAGRVERLQQDVTPLADGRRDSRAFQQLRRRLQQLPPAPAMPKQ